MRSRTPLALMEQVIMVLVFALAAALCLRAFVLSDSISQACAERDRALLALQSTAETLKHYRGDLAKTEETVELTLDNTDVVLYHSDHRRDRASDPDTLYIVILPTSGDPELLGRALLTAENADGETILAMETAWQEVTENA